MTQPCPDSAQPFVGAPHFVLGMALPEGCRTPGKGAGRGARMIPESGKYELQEGWKGRF